MRNNIIETLHLFPELTEQLLNLLKGLTEDEWNIESPIKGRTVKDLVSHLIDGSLRRLSLQRDNFADKTKSIKLGTYNDLVNFIQELNKEWIMASRRLSPKILIDLLKYSEEQLYNLFKSLNLDEKALFPVAWAGEKESENWFDIAREYTEKWHHQMQIRMALNKPLIMDEKYISPLYKTFMLALPYHYRNYTNYNQGEIIKITLTGKLNISWFLEKNDKQWCLIYETERNIGTEITIPETIAWVIFTNTDMDKGKYLNEISIKGDKELGAEILNLVTVMS